MRVRLHITGTLLCDADNLESFKTFAEVLDDVIVEHGLHEAEIELVELTDVEEGPEPKKHD